MLHAPIGDHLHAGLRGPAGAERSPVLRHKESAVGAARQTVGSASGLYSLGCSTGWVDDVDAAVTDGGQRDPVIVKPHWPFGEAESFGEKVDFHSTVLSGARSSWVGEVRTPAERFPGAISGPR